MKYLQKGQKGKTMTNVVSISQFNEKLYLLDHQQRETVFLFINFLLSKKSINKSSNKQVLLNTSVWNENDIQSIEQVQKEMNKWTIKTL
jgi:hypothetical protein